MRQVIAGELASDPDKYNEAFLGRPNAEYCNWIKKPESWGGVAESCSKRVPDGYSRLIPKEVMTVHDGVAKTINIATVYAL
ncbi:hypothetical protein J6590_060835 [Homalodisca vitripennis]|nr:hypothetical protein J6590_060835 [Homalodisca vitripennis]